MAQFFYAFNELNPMSQVVDELAPQPIDGIFQPASFPWIIGGNASNGTLDEGDGTGGWAR